MLDEIKKFWEIEDIFDSSSNSTNSFIHEKRFDFLQSSVKFENGRYTIQLPWKTDSPMLPDIFLPSKANYSLLKRLKQKLEVLNVYNDIISNQEKESLNRNCRRSYGYCIR